MLHLSTFMDVVCLCVISVCFICIAVTIEDRERTKVGWPTIFVCLALFMLYLWSNSFIMSFFRWGNLYKVGIYILIGLIWSLFMWFRFVKTMADRWEQYKLNMSTKSYQQDVSSFRPIVSENKQQITGWIIFWPFSVIRYFLGSLIKDLGDWVVARMTILYNKITHSQFKRFDNENPTK